MVHTAAVVAQLVQEVPYWLDDRKTVVLFTHGQEIFLFSKASRPSVKLCHTHIQRLWLAHIAREKRPVHKADHSPPYSAHVKNELPFNFTQYRERRQKVYCNKNSMQYLFITLKLWNKNFFQWPTSRLESRPVLEELFLRQSEKR
jgi:hypothetical protein